APRDPMPSRRAIHDGRGGEFVSLVGARSSDRHEAIPGWTAPVPPRKLARMFSPAAWAALLALFFSSGAAGLIYEIVWMRLLSLTLSVTVYAVTTVLCAFM